MRKNSHDLEKIRKFGWIAFVFFGCLCVVGIWFKKPIPILFFGTLSVLGIGFIIIPIHLTPVYLAWLKIAHFLSKVITIAILTLAYFLVLTPTALIKLVFGGRPLPLKPQKDTNSYWKSRVEGAQSKEQFLKRF